MGSRKEGNAEQKAKGLDGNNMLTPEGRKMNAAKRQLEKAQTAVNNNVSGSGKGPMPGQGPNTARNFLNKYNTLKDQKKKSREQLSQLGNMNRQMGYNPTTGMGIGESANFNTIGAGRDLQGIANLLGKLPTPMNIARQVLGGLTNVGSNLKTDFTNTANALSQFQQAPNLSTGFSGLYNNFLNSLNTEEETYDGPFPVQKPMQPDAFMQAYNEDMSGVSPYGATDGTFREKILNPVTDYVSSFKSDATLGDLKDQYSIYGGDFNALNFEPGVGQSSTTPEINISPGFRPNVLTYGGGLPVTYGTSDDDIMQGGYVGYSGTGPYSVDFNTMGQPFDRQNRNQGGLIPPMSGPMSNGLGNLFKMK